MKKIALHGVFLLMLVILLGAGCTPQPAATSQEESVLEPQAFSDVYSELVPPNTNERWAGFDVDGDGEGEFAVLYTVPNVEILPGLFDTVHYLRVFRYQNGEWQVIKEDERHETAGAGQLGQFCLFDPVKFEGVAHEFLLVSKCHAWGANEGYYVFGQIRPGEFGDLEIPKAYLNESEYLTEPGDRYLGLKTVEVVSDGLVEHYGVACDEKPDTYGHFGGADAGYCRTIDIKQTYDGNAFLSTPTEYVPPEPPGPIAYKPKFDGIEVKIGDQVRDMTLDAFNCSANADCTFSFSGETELAGHYEVYGDDVAFLGGEVCFNRLDEASLARVPVEDSDNRDVWFCFPDAERASSLFPSASGIATIVIEGYDVVMAGKEVWNSATLVRVLHAE